MRASYLFSFVLGGLFAALLTFSLLGPQGPTGFAVAPATNHLTGELSIVTDQFADGFGRPVVRITVLGDLVYDEVMVNGEVRTLSGTQATDKFLSDKGSILVSLPEGEHVVHAYSCTDTIAGWQCGCRNPEDCGHWMKRDVIVE